VFAVCAPWRCVAVVSTMGLGVGLGTRAFKSTFTFTLATAAEHGRRSDCDVTDMSDMCPSVIEESVLAATPERKKQNTKKLKTRQSRSGCSPFHLPAPTPHSPPSWVAVDVSLAEYALGKTGGEGSAATPPHPHMSPTRAESRANDAMLPTRLVAHCCMVQGTGGCCGVGPGRGGRLQRKAGTG